MLKQQEDKNSIISLTKMFPENVELQLFDIFKQLQKHYGTNYMFFSYQDITTQQSYVFQTNPDWNQAYVHEGLMNNCPLLTQGKKIMHQHRHKDIMFAWKNITYTNKKEKTVLDARKDFGIFHGMSASKEFLGIRQMFGMATEEKNHYFIHRLLDDYCHFARLIAKARKSANTSILNNETNFSFHVKLPSVEKAEALAYK